MCKVVHPSTVSQSCSNNSRQLAFRRVSQHQCLWISVSLGRQEGSNCCSHSSPKYPSPDHLIQHQRGRRSQEPALNPCEFLIVCPHVHRRVCSCPPDGYGIKALSSLSTAQGHRLKNSDFRSGCRSS